MKIERKFEDCSDNLAERIIKQSYQIKQKQSWLKAFISLFAEFKMPNPAYIMPVLFLCGLMISFSLFQQPTDASDFIDSMYLSL